MASPSRPGPGLALGLPSRGVAALTWSGEGRRQTSAAVGAEPVGDMCHLGQRPEAVRLGPENCGEYVQERSHHLASGNLIDLETVWGRFSSAWSSLWRGASSLVQTRY